MENSEIYNIVNLILIALVAIRIFWNKNEKTIILIILTSLFSILCSIQYLLLNAPDVAITEVSIGACITTIFLLKSASYLKNKSIDDKKESKKDIIFQSVSFIVLFIIFILFFEKSSFHFSKIFSNELPFLYNNTIKYYIEQTKNFLQFPNIVTAVIISFRGYDTFIETLVILTAGISVISILSTTKTFQIIKKSSLFDKSVITNMLMMIMPFIILFAFYIQAHGEESPGGGFQSGSILASAIIGYSLVISEDAIRKYLKNKLLIRIGSIGVLMYFIIGSIPLFKGQEFLNHNYVACNSSNQLISCLASSQKISIFIAELGVGITVFAVMTMIFFNLKNEERHD